MNIMSSYIVSYDDGSTIVLIDEDLVKGVNELDNPQGVKSIVRMEENKAVDENGALVRQVKGPLNIL